MLSFASVIASLQTGHWFATPFAMLFTFGYGYVALLVAGEQAARRRESVTSLVSTASERPSALPEEADALETDLAA
jgi:hypothetical protein